jgi:hypothetical protein
VAVPREHDARLLNFVVVGDVRAGTSAVQGGLRDRPGVVCHDNLLHPDDATRRAAHEGYFGQSANPGRLPEWFVGDLVSPWQYLTHVVFDNPLRGEQAVGLRIWYPEVARWELWELFERRCREGDFCLVHVTRNPAVCLVSLLQARKSGLWSRGPNEPSAGSPCPVRVEADELAAFCRSHQAVRDKIRRSCDDVLEVPYKDLFQNYQAVMHRVFDFLELPESDVPVSANCRRLRNRSVRDRLSNFDSLYREAPSDVRQLLGAEDLF